MHNNKDRRASARCLMWHSAWTVPPSDPPVRQMNTLCRHCDPGCYALRLTINLCGHWFTQCEVSVDLCTFTQRYHTVVARDPARHPSSRAHHSLCQCSITNYNLQWGSSLHVCVCVSVGLGFCLYLDRESVFEHDCSCLLMWEDSVLILPGISNVLMIAASTFFTPFTQSSQPGKKFALKYFVNYSF